MICNANNPAAPKSFIITTAKHHGLGAHILRLAMLYIYIYIYVCVQYTLTFHSVFLPPLQFQLQCVYQKWFVYLNKDLNKY